MFFKILNAHRDFTPAAVAPKKNFNRRTGNTSSSLSAAAIWGTGAVPSFLMPVLLCSGKRNFPEPLFFHVLGEETQAELKKIFLIIPF